jgi:tetratricopeptide (TPR) repeat protein
LWRVFVPLAIVLVTVGLYRLVSLRHVTTGLGLASPALNGLTQAIVIWRYLALLVWPADQAIMHSVHRVWTLGDPIAWLAVTGLAVLMIGALRLRRAVPFATFGVVWFFAAIAPSSSVVALREGMAEHRVYLASAGIITVATAGLSILFARARRGRRSVPYGFAVAVCVMLAVLSLLTVRRNQVWASPISLWTEAVGRAPGMWEPHYALADALRDSGDCDHAVAEYRQVVAMRPAHRDAHTNLGVCLGQTGHLEEAEAALRRVIEIDPSFVRAYTNLAAVALVAGDTVRARDYYREAIDRDPANVLARLQLAALYERTFHDYHAAARMCGEARQLAPATPGVIECVERNQRLAAGR